MYWQARFERIDIDLDIKEEIIKIRKQHPHYGYRRVHAELLNRGYKLNKKRTQRIYQELEMQINTYGRKYRKYNSYKGVKGRIEQNRINRRFHSRIPLQKITTDTTEFKYYRIDRNGKLQIKKAYLDPFMDLYNLEIISFKITKQPNGASMIEALQEAIEKTKDCPFRRTFHSDRGWAYQMHAYQDLLKENKIFQSMSRKGNCYDNSPMENFFGILKQEMYYGYVYKSFEELSDAITSHIRYYNEERIKESLGYLSPVQYRRANTVV